jgi:hypothetical protein
MIHPHFLRWLSGSVVAVAVLALGFIWTIDPYGVSPIRIELPGVNALKPKRVDIDRLIKPYETWWRQPRTVFLGTSRIHQSFDPALLQGTMYAPAYNASVPGATIAENVSLLEQYIKTDKNLKYVFFELFLYMMIIPTFDIPTKGGISDIVAALPTLHFSTSAALDSVTSLQYNRTSSVRPQSISEGGYGRHGDDFDPSLHFIAQAYSQFVLGENKKVPNMRLEKATLEALKRAQALCDQRGIKLTFILAPNYPWDDYRLLSTGYWHLVRDLYDFVADLPDVLSFSQFNELTSEPAGAMKFWYDPFHFSRLMGARILDGLAGRNEGLPKDFMLPINRQTVDYALEARWEGLRDWIKSNADFPAIFDATRMAVEKDGTATGAIDVERRSLIVDGVVHPIVSESAGVVETVVRNSDHMVISGWAADIRSHRTAEAIIGTVDSAVVTKWFTGTPRVDNEALYGRDIRPSNFVMRVPGAPPDPSLIRIFAVMRDGRAVQIPSTNPLVTGSAVLSVAGEIDREILRIGGRIYPITPRMAGSLESATVAYPGYLVRGWAVDRVANGPVATIVATAGNSIVAQVAPTILRPDVEQGVAPGARPAGFAVHIPVTEHVATIRVFALMADGVAVQLASQLGQSTGGAFANLTLPPE